MDRMFEVEALSLHTSTTCTKFNGPVESSGGACFFFYTSSGRKKRKAYFSKKIMLKLETQSTPQYYFYKSHSVSLGTCVEGETVSCLISKFSQRMWTPC